MILKTRLSLCTELSDQAFDHIVILCMYSENQTCFRNGLKTVHDPAVIGHRQAAELILPALGSLMKKSLEGDDSLSAFMIRPPFVSTLQPVRGTSKRH